MIRQELNDYLVASGINPEAFDVLGTDLHPAPGDIYVLRRISSGVVGRADYWSIYYSERGQEVGLQRFNTEDEACLAFLSVLMRDPMVRRGPMNAIERVVKAAIDDGNAIGGVSEDWGRIKSVIHFKYEMRDVLWAAVQKDEPSLDTWRSHPTPHNKAERGFVDARLGLGLSFPDNNPRG